MEINLAIPSHDHFLHREEKESAQEEDHPAAELSISGQERTCSRHIEAPSHALLIAFVANLHLEVEIEHKC